jgi:hypothetical protein
MRTISGLAVLGAFALLPACFAIQPVSMRPRTTADAPGGLGRLGASIDSVRSRPDEGLRDGRGARPLHVEERRVCRTGGWPRGWVAVAYESAGESECPARADSERERGVAIIRRLDGTPVGGVLEVCADQGVPRDWTREWTDEPRAMATRCAGATKGDARDTMVIRRLR